MKKILKKILKIIAFVNVFYRMNFDLFREGRLLIIEYSMQELTNPYTKI